MAQRFHYPSISLPEAVERLALIYDKEGQHPMTSEVAVQHMGYSGLNGASMTVLSALKKYGLLEGRAEDIRVTATGVIIISDEGADDQSERSKALRVALVSHPLFKELSERFEGRVSELNITSYLQKKGFKPAAAKSAAKSYMESSKFVEKEVASYNSDLLDQEDITEMSQTAHRLIPARGQEIHQEADNTREYQEAPIVISGVSQWPIIRLPKQFTAKNWDDMMSILNAMKSGFVTNATKDITQQASLEEGGNDQDS